MRNTEAQTQSPPHKIPRKQRVPSLLDELVSPDAYLRANSQVFRSRGSLDWFNRQHHVELVEKGALAKLNGRWLIHAERHAEVTLEIGRRAAAAR